MLYSAREFMAYGDELGASRPRDRLDGEIGGYSKVLR